ncbi:MAG: Coenzyme PQQ synthesis protein E [Paracidovorax wautersii]|uniref:Coenzyme PQQ synthesis protein E n=1 Tax=Paracidovorax wautersii TaxID=1177982 RepID=A0A7V8FKK7_9BURK|nr:MAG: Coenzyme PQQ synthesis protein E [Paracidovorax wautersii]
MRELPLADIWQRSNAFNAYRGDHWMQAPCRDCDEKHQDHGGCRCQAWLLTGDPSATDPVCSRSPQRGVVDAAIAAAQDPAGGGALPLVFRTDAESRRLAAHADAACAAPD